jgi:hypothetical protein
MLWTPILTYKGGRFNGLSQVVRCGHVADGCNRL